MPVAGEILNKPAKLSVLRGGLCDSLTKVFCFALFLFFNNPN